MALPSSIIRPRARALLVTSLSALALLVASEARAGTITALGNVTALDDISQMTNITGTAEFNEGPVNAQLPLEQYAAQGIHWHTGSLASILPGVVQAGTAANPIYQNNLAYFPAPIAGGGLAEMFFTFYGGAVTFDQDITQFGLTASRNGSQYLTVWDKNGTMIGQINWVPSNDAAFIGVDTQGVPIGMITYGNDNVWNGATYGIGGSTIISDTWVWGTAEPPCGNGVVDAEEVCDDGLNDGFYGSCSVDCQTPMPRCGDGVLDPVIDAEVCEEFTCCHEKCEPAPDLDLPCQDCVVRPSEDMSGCDLDEAPPFSITVTGSSGDVTLTRGFFAEHRGEVSGGSSVTGSHFILAAEGVTIDIQPFADDATPSRVRDEGPRATAQRSASSSRLRPSVAGVWIVPSGPSR